MTDIKAEVVEFELHPHPNADLLSIAKLCNKGWQCVVKTSDMVDRRTAIYIPIDAEVPTDRPEFTFLAKGTKAGRARIKTIRLRQAISQGLLISAPTDAQVGDDFTERLGVTRWEPAIPTILSGDMVREPGNFQKYTSIENWKNFPDVFKEGDAIRVTEKIHGTNCRWGFVDDGSLEGMKFFVGTHKTARKKEGTNLYSQMSLKLEIEKKLESLLKIFNPTTHLIIFGEIYGSQVQDLTYDCANNHQEFRIFDVLLDHVYQSWEIIELVARTLNIQTVPLLYRGHFELDKVLALRDGSTTLGANHVREGVVVTANPAPPDEEPLSHGGAHKSASLWRSCPAACFDEMIGRKILKFVSDEFLLRKNASDGH